MLLDTAATNAVTQAVQDAERRTGAEIVAIVAPRSDAYVFPAAVTGFAIGTATALGVFHYGLLGNFYYLLLMQAIATIVAFAILQETAWAGFLVPKTRRQSEVRRYASEQFFTRRLHATRARNGVLIFISVQERCVELIVDIGVHAVLPDTVWQEIVDRLVGDIKAGRMTDGLVNAVAACGDLLARHFPVVDDVNELPDTPVEMLL